MKWILKMTDKLEKCLFCNKLIHFMELSLNTLVWKQIIIRRWNEWKRVKYRERNDWNEFTNCLVFNKFIILEQLLFAQVNEMNEKE